MTGKTDKRHPLFSTYFSTYCHMAQGQEKQHGWLICVCTTPEVLWNHDHITSPHSVDPEGLKAKEFGINAHYFEAFIKMMKTPAEVA